MKKIMVLIGICLIAMGVIAYATTYPFRQEIDDNSMVMDGSAYNANTSFIYVATATLSTATSSVIDVASNEVLTMQYVSFECVSPGSTKIGPSIGHMLNTSKWVIGLASNSTYIDQTTAAQGTGNITLFETDMATEAILVGASEKFSQVFFDVSTVAANTDSAFTYASFTYYYYDGIDATFTQMFAEVESNYGVATSAATGIIFIPPVRWDKAALSEQTVIATSTWYAGYASQSKFMDNTTKAQGGTTDDFTLFNAGGNSATNGFIIASPSSFNKIEVLVSTASGRSNATSSFYYYNGRSATWTALVTSPTTLNWNAAGATSVTFTPPNYWRTTSTLTEWSTMPAAMYLIKAIANGNGVAQDTKADRIIISTSPSTTERYWIKIMPGGLGTNEISRASTVYVSDPLEIANWAGTELTLGAYGMSPIVMGTRGDNKGEGLVYYCKGDGSTKPNITVYGNKFKY